MATGTIILPVQAAKLPTTNPARIDGGYKNWALLFDAATAQSAAWHFRLPANYSSSPVLKIQFVPLTTQSGTNACIFNGSVMAVTPDDAANIDTDSYDIANAGTKTLANNEAAGTLKELSIPLSNLDGAVAGDLFKLKLERDAANGSDTMTGDAAVVNVSLEYTTT